MGAWGVGPLENDGASDFVYEIADRRSWKPGVKQIKRAAKDLKKTGQITAPDGEMAIGAAALIALQRGHAVADWAGEVPPSEIKPCPEKIVSLVRGLAARAIEGPGSELRDLWADADELGAWVESSSRCVRAIG